MEHVRAAACVNRPGMQVGGRGHHAERCSGLHSLGVGAASRLGGETPAQGPGGLPPRGRPRNPLVGRDHTALPIASLAELVDRVAAPNLGVVLDTANVVRVGSDLMEATRLLAGATDMVHMKDVDLSGAGFGDPGGWWPCTSLGGGDLDLHGVLVELRSVGFGGLICVELATLPPGSDEDRMVAESVARLRESIRP